MKGTKTEYEQKLVSCDTFVVMPDLSGSGEVRRSKSKCKDQLNKILYFRGHKVYALATGAGSPRYTLVPRAGSPRYTSVIGLAALGTHL